MQNLIFVSRKFPPSVGGMQKQNYELYKNLTRFFNIKLISLGRGQKNLIWFFPYAFLKSFLALKNNDKILLGDGLLSPLGHFFKKFFNKKVYCVIHGLDVTYDNSLYQKIVSGSLKKLDKIICVSKNTVEECVKRGIEREKCFFVPNGIDESKINFPREESRKLIEKRFNLDLKNKKVILTLGRLRKRKGVHWFLTNVFDKLRGNVVYLIVGDGAEKSRIKKSLNDRSFLLTDVNDKEKEHIYNITDIFIMPNIPVKGDVEGFGIVSIEATIKGIPVIASNIEGIKDAIFDSKNGFLVETKDTNKFIEKINEVLDMSPEKLEKFRKNQISFTKEKFGWKTLGEEYFRILK